MLMGLLGLLLGLLEVMSSRSGDLRHQWFQTFPRPGHTPMNF